MRAELPVAHRAVRADTEGAVSKLRFDVRAAPLSRLIVNLANPRVLASNLPTGMTPEEIVAVVDAISTEIDRRLPLK